MGSQKERRRWARADLTPPEVCVLFYGNNDSEFQTVLENPADRFFVDLFNKTQGGALLRTSQKIETDTLIHLQIYSSNSKAWELFTGD